MGKLRITGDHIAISQIADDEGLRRRLDAMQRGDTIVLEVGGYVGLWQRAPDGLVPLDTTVAEAWAAMHREPGMDVDIHLVTTDGSLLVTFGLRGERWDPPDSQYR